MNLIMQGLSVRILFSAPRHHSFVIHPLRHPPLLIRHRRKSIRNPLSAIYWISRTCRSGKTRKILPSLSIKTWE